MPTEKNPTHIITIRVVYKSGYTHDFDVTDFSVNQATLTYTWTAWNPANAPLLIGVDDIAAVWQVNIRPWEPSPVYDTTL